MHMYIDTHKAPQTSSCCMSYIPFESHSYAIVKNISAGTPQSGAMGRREKVLETAGFDHRDHLRYQENG